MADLSISAQFIKGVGPARLKVLNKIGIETIEDLLYYLPRRYEDRSNIRPISDIEVGKFQTIKGKVLALGGRRTKKGLSLFQMAVGDASGVIYATWFNQPYMKDRFKVGQELILYGKVERYRDLQINTPEYEILSGKGEDSIHIGRIVPIYPLIQELNQRWLRKIMKEAVDRYASSVKEILPFEIRKRQGLILLSEAIRNIHFPVSNLVLEKARRRLIFDEFFLLQLGIAIKRSKIEIDLDGVVHKIDGELIKIFKDSMPFELTASQKKVVSEIEQDMQSPKPMNRLLQGDVGSGKTVVATWAMVLSVQSGYQAALMAPTEILAQQHYKSISKLLKALNLKVVLLSGDAKQDVKRRIKDTIERGEADIIIGTHALIQEGVKFRSLGLVIIDEQHKFGVLQRRLLRSKSQNPDILVMTATPIPRTLALTVYGDLDVSIIDELPPGRRDIKTLHFKESERGKAYRLIREQVDLGRQVYVVYPIIEESENLDLKAATQMFKELKEEFKDFSVGLLHGRMKSNEKERIMGEFKDGRLQILVSTIVIEVGVDIPNASVMLVEHAERFGLSQLHQLRGRIGRGNYLSYCILLSDTKTEDAQRRIEAMLNTQDGFKIAEEDLEIRGPGEFFGTKQHGLPEIKIGNILRDSELLEIAKQEAFELINKDRELKAPQYTLLKLGLRKKFRFTDLELVTVS